MTDQTISNKALARRIYEEMWNQHNPAVAQEIFASPEGVQRFMKEFLQAFPDLQHTIETMIAEDDRVVTQFSARATHTGKWKEYPSTGKSIHYTGVTLARLANGKIVDHHTWWDTLELIQQISGETKSPDI